MPLRSFLKRFKSMYHFDSSTNNVEKFLEHQGCELDRFLIKFTFVFKRHLQVRVQRFLLFEFGKNDQVRVHSPFQNIL